MLVITILDFTHKQHECQSFLRNRLRVFENICALYLLLCQTNVEPPTALLQSGVQLISGYGINSRSFLILSQGYHTEDKREQRNGFAKADNGDVL